MITPAAMKAPIVLNRVIILSVELFRSRPIELLSLISDIMYHVPNLFIRKILGK